MKKGFLLATSVLFLFGCSKSPEKIAGANISKYMTDNINDPKGYESVRFGEMRKDSTFVSDEPLYKLYQDSMNAIDKLMEKNEADYLGDIVSHKRYLEIKSDFLDQEISILGRKKIYLESYKSKPCGFGMMHVYRKKKESGGVVLDSMYFSLDSSYSVKPKSYYSLINR